MDAWKSALEEIDRETMATAGRARAATYSTAASGAALAAAYRLCLDVVPRQVRRSAGE
jgi:hypothetical protein